MLTFLIHTLLRWPSWTEWLILAAILLSVELVHAQWILIWFAAGAAASSVAALVLPQDLAVQVGLFFVVSLGLTAGARPITYRLLFKRHGDLPTNVAAIIGREETCIEDIDNTKGRGAIRVYGSAWHALSHQEEVTIKAGQKVRVIAIRDLELIVEPVASTVEAGVARGRTDHAG